MRRQLPGYCFAVCVAGLLVASGPMPRALAQGTDPKAPPPPIPAPASPTPAGEMRLASDFAGVPTPTKRDVTQDANLIFYGAQGDLAKFVRLYQLGGSVNAKQKDGTTALMAAASKGRLEVVKFIVLRGGTVEMANDIGETALTVAAGNGHLAVVQYLLE
ncbi:MAG: ankyrin repeat domain-containing protein, partial [Armatimonadota bacterium]